ncbi:glycosyltransferase 87 family protein [Saccharothrix lopnurensis]|uniref:Glycosyltransferase 87 family protein n=1 Tax=Saccharothrix lopnurensis TaxID=1670621 RepID=A0ABW1NYL7_9PSEU
MISTDPRRLTVLGPVAAIAIALAVQALLIFGPFIPFWMNDFAVYQGAGHAVLAGLPLYGTSFLNGALFTYSPFAAVLTVPTALLPAVAAQFTWTVAGYLALSASIWLALRITGATTARRHTAVLVAACTAGASLLAPVQLNVLLGQINLVLMALVLLDFLPSLPERYRGIATGIAAGIKLTPLFFVAYLFFTGRRRAAYQALAAFAATALVGFALLPADSRTYWFQGTFYDATRVMTNDLVVNHSLPGFLARVLGESTAPLWALLVAGVVAVACLAAAVWAWHRGHDVVGLLVIAFAAQLVSPVTWVHHAVWVMPALIWLATAGWRRATALPRALLVLTAAWYCAPLWIVGMSGPTEVPFHFTPAGNLFVTLTGIVVPAAIAIALLPVWLPRLRPVEPERARPEQGQPERGRPEQVPPQVTPTG